MTSISAEELQEFDSVNAQLGETIHTLMWRQKVSQTEIGRVLGITQGSVSRKLRGQTQIEVVELMKIARVLGVDPGDLLPHLDSNQEPSD